MPNYKIILDSESTLSSKPADIAFLLLKNNKVIEKHSYLTPYYLSEELFYNRNDKTGAFSKKILERKHKHYDDALKLGNISLVGIPYIQKLLDSWIAKYKNIEILAYNVKYDINLLESVGIVFAEGYSFSCLWELACCTIVHNKKYAPWCLSTKPPRITPSLSLSTSCDTVLDFAMQHAPHAFNENTSHPHYALEDCEGELLLYRYMLTLKKRSKQQAYNHRNFKLADHLNYRN